MLMHTPAQGKPYLPVVQRDPSTTTQYDNKLCPNYYSSAHVNQLCLDIYLAIYFVAADHAILIVVSGCLASLK